MAITYAEITGPTPKWAGTEIYQRLRVEAWPNTTNEHMTWAAEDETHDGPIIRETTAAGGFDSPFLIPLGSDQGAVAWTFFITPLDRIPGVTTTKRQRLGSKIITADIDWDTLVSDWTELTAVTPDIINQVGADAAAAQQARDEAEAFGGTNDTIIASRLNDDTSATATAADARIADQAVGRSELALVPEDFGALGNWNGTTGTDDTAAFQTMIDLLAAGTTKAKHIQLSRGKNYVVNGLVPSVGLKIVGAGTQSRMTCTTGDMFTISGSLYAVTFEDAYLLSHTTGGHLFSMATGANLSGAKFNRCILTVYNPAKSIIDAPAVGAFIENTFTDCDMSLSGNSHTVPGFYLRSTAGGLNCNQWIRGRFTYTGNYAIWLESTSVSNYCYDNLVQDVNFEICNGGAVAIFSGNNNRIVGAVIYDLVGATTKDLFRVGKTTGGLASKYTIFQNVQRRGGSLGSGLYDIKFDGANGATFNTVEDCDTGTGSGFQIQWSFSAGFFKGGTGITHTGDDAVFKQIYAADLIQEKLLATVTGIDAKTVAVTNLYTVPTGKKLNVTKIVVRCTAASSVSVAPTVGAGSDAGGVNMFPAEVLTGLNATTQSWHMVGKGLRPIVSAAGIVKLGITGGSTATTHTLAVDVFGYLTA